jgi:hypothetical protein
VIPLGGQDAKDIERTITDFSQGSNGGLIAVATPLTVNNRDLIIASRRVTDCRVSIHSAFSWLLAV